MKKFFFNIPIFFLGLLLLFTWGCSNLSTLSEDNNSQATLSLEQESEVYLDDLLENPATTQLSTANILEITRLSEEGIQAEQSGNMNQAAIAMEKVLAIDPNNATANLILGLNDINALISNEQTRDKFNRITGLISDTITIPTVPQGATLLTQSTRLQSSIINNILFVTSTENAAIQEILTTIEQHIPHLNSAIVRLQRALSQPDFNYHVLNEELSINHTITRNDLLGVYCALNLIRGFIDMGLAYDMTFREDAYISTEDWFTKNPKFLTLRPNGAAHMKRAGRSISNAITAVLEGNKNATNPMTEETYTGLQKIRRSLKGETIEIPFSIQNNDSTERIDHILAINLGNFFNSPIPDFRRYLGIHIKGKLSASAFPSGFDFTLGGLFPNLNTYDDWQTYNSFGLIFYNIDNAAGESKITSYEKIIKTKGSLLAVSNTYNYNNDYSDAIAEIFRISGTTAHSLGVIPHFDTNYTYYNNVGLALSENHIYCMKKNTLIIYEIAGNTLVKRNQVTLPNNEDLQSTHIHQNTLYVINNTAINRYSLADPENPVLIDSKNVNLYSSWHKDISFKETEMAVVNISWNYPQGYTATMTRHNLDSGELLSTSTTESGSGYPSIGYLDNDILVSIPKNDYSGYTIHWASGETASIHTNNYYADLQINNGFLSYQDSTSEFGIYDISTAGTAQLVGKYKRLSGFGESYILPTKTGAWVHTADSKLHFVTY